MKKQSIFELKAQMARAERAYQDARERRIAAGGLDPVGSPPAAVTPPTNRGVEVTNGGEENRGVEFSIDWLSFSVFTSAEILLPWLVKLMPSYSKGDEAWEYFRPSGETGFYTRLFKGPFGIAVCASPRAAGAPDHCHVSIPGSACQLLGLVWFVGLLEALQVVPWRVSISRIDTAWDGSDVSPRRAWAALKKGNVRTTAKLGQRGNVEGVRPKCAARRWEDLWGNATTYVGGGAGSGTLLRVYNYRGCNRVEMQKRGTSAAALAENLLGRPVEKWSGIACRALERYCAFVDRKSDVNVSRCKRLSWWESFVQAAGSEAVSFKRLAGRVVKGAGLLLSQARIGLERAFARIAAAPGELVGDVAAAVERAKANLKDAAAAKRRDLEDALRAVASGGMLQCELWPATPASGVSS